jgi:Icc-related predicted phosphoesterase
VIVDSISDLHGYYPQLEGGDLLIVAGDLTARDTIPEYFNFFDWLEKQKYRKKIVIAGNHDNFLLFENVTTIPKGDFEYLCDSSTEFEGLKIWGTPWTKTFEGMNPKCRAFTFDTEEELAEKFALIPKDIDILVTHSPPWTILDQTFQNKQVGSTSLLIEMIQRLKAKLVIFGHIHEAYGQIKMWDRTEFVNASHVDHKYRPVNKPIRIVL